MKKPWQSQGRKDEKRSGSSAIIGCRPGAITPRSLGNRRLSEAAGRRLKGLSGAVMLALGLVLLLRPGWLI